MVESMRYSIKLTIVFVLVLEACGGSVTEDRWPVHRVMGRVVGPTAAAVTGASVTVRALWGAACDRTMALSGPFITDQTGRYVGGFGDAAGTFDGCIDVTVVPPDRLGLGGTTKRVPDLHLDAARADSVVVNLELAVLP